MEMLKNNFKSEIVFSIYFSIMYISAVFQIIG